MLLFSDDPGGKLHDIFAWLSQQIPVSKWRYLYRALMKTKSHVINIEAKISFIEHRSPQDLKEQIYQGFIHWLQEMGKDATVARLCKSLREVKLLLQAEVVEKMVANDTPEVVSDDGLGGQTKNYETSI